MSENENVAEVLARLKEEVRRRQDSSLRSGDAWRSPSVEPATTGGLAILRQVYATTRVNPHLPIGWPRLPAGILPKITAMLQKAVRRSLRWYINPIVEQQNAYNAAVTAALETLVLQAERYHQTSFKDIETSKLRLQRLERAVRAAQEQGAPAVAPQSGVVLPSRGQAIDYFGLELRFRGPQLLRERQKVYLQYFEGQQQVLDIGCGRGEFVEMLGQQGIRARGIDLDSDSVAYAQERGIPVERAEAVAYLQGLPDGSLGGVFASQVVEHLQPQHLARMLELCHDKLAPDAPIVLETLNPACLMTLANWFVIDPTHVWPIHSETLKFLLETAGFWKIEVQFLSPVSLEQRLLSIPAHAKLGGLDAETCSLLNHNIDLLNNMLFGYQDYAAIARRPPQDIGAEA